jgi:hypothetical protein
MCVHVSVLVSVYIIRVHCPLHHALVYILWSCKNLKLHEVKYKIPKFYILSIDVGIKVQEMKLKWKNEVCLWSV